MRSIFFAEVKAGDQNINEGHKIYENDEIEQCKTVS